MYIIKIVVAAIVVILCLLSSFLSAVAAVFQRQAAGGFQAKQLFSRRLIAGLSKNKKWLTGMGIEITSSLINGGALYLGAIILVEPLLTTDLVFLMLILHSRYHIGAGRREWAGVLSVCGGLTMLLIAAAPKEGNKPFDSMVWLILYAGILIMIGVGALLMRSLKSPNIKAGIGGVITGLNLGLTAGLVKLMFHRVHVIGPWHVMASWAFFAFLGSAVLSIIVIQSTFAAGPLVFSQPAIEIFGPLVSIAIGIILFGDTVRLDDAALPLEIVGGSFAALGVILLGNSGRLQQSPQTLYAE